jgi:Outer membrane protein
MKRQFVVVFMTVGLLIAASTANAQNKIGYISLQELIPAMPEYKKAVADLDEYQKALVDQGNDYQQEFIRKDSIYKADSTKWSSAMREVKRKELNELYMKWMNFNQEAEQLYQRKQQELIAPIQQKAVSTTQTVARENGYSYVISKETLISFPSADDLLPLVSKKMNIKIDKPDSTSGGTAAPKTGSK